MRDDFAWVNASKSHWGDLLKLLKIVTGQLRYIKQNLIAKTKVFYRVKTVYQPQALSKLALD